MDDRQSAARLEPSDTGWRRGEPPPRDEVRTVARLVLQTVKKGVEKSAKTKKSRHEDGSSGDAAELSRTEGR